MCGGKPFRNIFRAVQTVQPRPVIQERTPQPPVQLAAVARITCASCRTQVDARFSWCLSCGAAIKPQPCIYCGQTLSPGDTACSYCGAPRAHRAI